MIVEPFVRWCETASAAQRAEGVAILGRAWVDGEVPVDERRDAEAAFTLFLDDPSVRVRMALAAIMAPSAEAPVTLVLALCEDVEVIAGLVAERSPRLGDADLIDIVASRTDGVQAAVARRARVSAGVAAAIVEVGSRRACLALADNPGARMSREGLRRLVERFGDDGEIREALIARLDLPADLRQALVLRVARALSGMALARNAIGDRRIEAVAFGACEDATTFLANAVPDDGLAAFVEHLRASGQLCVAFLVRTVCAGNVDLFAAALVALGSWSERRVRSILVECRQRPLAALLKSCGLPAAATPLVHAALVIWRDVATGAESIAADDVGTQVLERVAADFRVRGSGEGFAELSALLHRLCVEAARTSAWANARRLAA